MTRFLVVGLTLGCASAPERGPVADDASEPSDIPVVDVPAQPPTDPGPDPGEDATPPLPNLPLSAIPCEHPDAWPRRVEAHDDDPFLVHYQRAADEPMAIAVHGHLVDAWSAQVGGLGFRAPPSDDGFCGPDGRFDVFLWDGQESAYVDVLGGSGATDFADQMAYMGVDPWSEYGGELLRPTLFHELNHAFQAADDWFEPGAIYEMCATWIEGRLVPQSAAWQFVLDDYQAHPDWTLDRYDDYETWFMYGSAAFLHFLEERWFEGDGGFAAEMWLGARGPDTWVAALDDLLEARGSSFREAAVEFAVWRWRPTDPSWPAPATTTAAVDPDPMMLGSAYVEVAPGQVATVLAPQRDDLEWVLQAVDGGVVLTALPTGAYDPESVTDERFDVALELTP